MKLRLDQLQDHLKKPLQPIYWVSGDVPLLVQETSDTIRQAARNQGFSERELYHVEGSFDWNQIADSAASMSLFGDKKIIELRMQNGKPNEAGKKVLVAYAENPSPDNVLLIISDKLDGATQKTKWFKSIETAATLVQIWPVEGPQLPQWIYNRMTQCGLSPSQDAVQLLSERVEGNLLAAAQEIEKLRLLYGETTIGAEEVQEAVASSARYDVFGLVDTALLGASEKALRMLSGVKAEGTDATIVLWALAREIRSLLNMAKMVERGIPVGKVIQEQRVWSNRKGPVQKALQRLSVVRLERLLQNCSVVDRSIKGLEKSAPWDGLSSILFQLAK